MRISPKVMKGMEEVARFRRMTPRQLQLAINAYENGGQSARALLAEYCLAPADDPGPQMTPEEIEELRAQLTAPPMEGETILEPAPKPIPPQEWR